LSEKFGFCKKGSPLKYITQQVPTRVESYRKKDLSRDILYRKCLDSSENTTWAFNITTYCHGGCRKKLAKL